MINTGQVGHQLKRSREKIYLDSGPLETAAYSCSSRLALIPPANNNSKVSSQSRAGDHDDHDDENIKTNI